MVVPIIVYMLLCCSLLEGQAVTTQPFRARSKTSCAGDVGGPAGKVPDARRAVSRRLQALRAAAAAAAAKPQRFVTHFHGHLSCTLQAVAVVSGRRTSWTVD